MEVTVVQKPEASELELTIAVSAEELKPYLRKAAAKLSRERPLSGFRPGKAPLEVVDQAWGENRVTNEALEQAVPRVLAEAVRQRNIEAIGRPAATITQANRQTGAVLTVRVAVLPKVILGDLTKLAATRRAVTVTDEEVERELKQLANLRSQYLDVARPAQAGDVVRIDFRITSAGKLVPGGEGQQQVVQLGEGYFVPDFEKGLLGISAGERREYTIVFPLDWQQPAMRGRQASVQVKVHAVQKRVMPEINDAFAKQLGAFPDLATLKYTLKSNLIREREVRERERLQAALADWLAESATFSALPAVLVDKEIDRRMAELNNLLKLQHSTLESYATGRTTTVAAVREELRERAVQGVKVGLALRQLVKDLNITVEEHEVNERANELLRHFSTVTQAQREWSAEDLTDRVRGQMLNERALARLEELAQIRDEHQASAAD